VANLRLGLAYLRLGDYQRAKECFQANIESLEGDLIFERFGEPGLVSVRSRIGLGRVLVESGEFTEGIVRAEEAVRIAERVDGPFTLVEACRNLGLLYLRKGDLAEAVSVLERGHRLCQACNIPTWLYGVASFLGYAYVVSGRLADGLPVLEQFQQAVLMGMGSRDYLTQPIIYLSEAYGLANRDEDAIRLANQALDFSRRHKRPTHETWALRALGEIASHRNPPDTEEAGAYYRQAMILAEEHGMRPMVAHCHLGLGKLFRRVGKCDEASEHLASATRMYRDMDMRFWLEQAQA
jgi:tetratricopeptide (TPR) repeat protein